MIQYEDLSLRDVHSYWRSSTLLFERKGKLIPCNIADINEDSAYPISLVDVISGDNLINLKLSTFIEKVLIHHPPLGYGDYGGLAFYMTTYAGRGMAKGVTQDRLVVNSPIDWTATVQAELKKISAAIRKETENGKAMPTNLVRQYTQYIALLGDRPNRNDRLLDGEPRRNSMLRGNAKARAQILQQCVNNLYPSFREAMTAINKVNSHGVSLSRDFALIKNRKSEVRLYHQLAYVGDLPTKSAEDMTTVEGLSKPAARAVRLLFNKVAGVK